MKRDRNFYNVELAKMFGATLLTIALMTFASSAYSQTITQDANGNFTATKKVPDKDQDEKTGKTYTHTDGKKYEVYKGSKGGLYVYRVRRSGKNIGQSYKYYLKLETGTP